MQTLLRFLRKYYFFFLFVIFEVLALSIYLRHFQTKRENFFNSASVITGSIYEKYHTLERYFYLSTENQKLARKNAQLRNKLANLQVPGQQNELPQQYSARFEYIPAEVINNTVNKNHNYLTLNKGAADSITPEMGVISPDGLIGIVRDVSEHYSLVISLLNIRLGISAKIKDNDYFGAVKWDGRNHTKAKLNEIPNYASIEKGDTVITSGYSAIFPEGIPLGIITAYEKPSNTNFYDITINLFTDFKHLNHVLVINNRMRKERKEIEDIL